VPIYRRGWWLVIAAVSIHSVAHLPGQISARRLFMEGMEAGGGLVQPQTA